MSDIRALNWFQRLQPKLTVVQVFLPVLAGVFWALTAGFLGQNTPEWVEPLALSVGLLVPVLIFGIDKVFPRDIDSVVEQLICNSDMVDDWYINPEYSGPDMTLSGQGTLNGDIGEQKREIAVYKKDPSLVITLYRSEGDNKEFMENWLEPLVADKEHNSMHRVSVTFNGAEVIQKNILNIDGGRCYFPLPKSPKPPIRSDFLSIAICQILNKKADYATQFYLKRAGVDILDVDRFDPKIVSSTVN
jgi:hypothetical protein